MDEDEDRGTGSNAGKRMVTLVLQNYVQWKAYMINEIKVKFSVDATFKPTKGKGSQIITFQSVIICVICVEIPI